MEYPSGKEACENLGEELRLSWIVIDLKGKHAVNVRAGERSEFADEGHGWDAAECEGQFGDFAELPHQICLAMSSLNSTPLLLGTKITYI
ncbi:F-box protein [Sesbania bispinosa]|nr:F-box protein [Sesbania bispinosa]